MTLPELIEAGDLQINTRKQEVIMAGKQVALSRRLYDIVLYLAEADGRPVSAEELVDRVFPNAVYKNTVEVHIWHIRRKMGQGVIVARSGFGYVLKGVA